MRFLLLLTAIICVSTVTAQTAARSYFKISPNILEGIRDILNRGNKEALQSVSTEVLEKIQELVEAEIEKFRYLGQKPKFAVESCKDINELQPCTASGYYWIDTESTLLGVWCEMNPQDKFNATGGFMKVVELDMRNNASSCPKGLKQVIPTGSTKRLCAPISTAAAQDSFKFDTHQVNYTKVCGRITGYQYGAPEAFYTYSTSISSRCKLSNTCTNNYDYCYIPFSTNIGLLRAHGWCQYNPWKPTETHLDTSSWYR